MDSGREFLHTCFSRRYKWREAEDGKVIVMRPRFGESGMSRKISGLFNLSDYRIKLDDIGTLVWKRCDGKTTAAEIADELRIQFGDRVEPAEDRLSRFVSQMLRARMIEVKSGDI